MLLYRCPIDRKELFRAEGPVGVRISIPCKQCKADGRSPYVTPVVDDGPVFQRTCRCTSCKRTQVIDCPVDDSMVCMVCGTRTLVVVEEVRPRPEHEKGRETVAMKQRQAPMSG